MLYVSTRGAGPVPLSTALELGLAPDGGLFVPATPIRARDTASPEAPNDDVDSSSQPWTSLADRLAPFLPTDWSRAEVESLVGETLAFPIPLLELEPGIFVLELFHGPSAAFKDVGARFLARALSRDVTRAEARAWSRAEAATESRTVLVATSGDTGGAVAAAFDGVAGTRVVVVYPEQGVTELQRRQFTTLGENVRALAVPGPFDECQRLVKQALAAPELSERFRLTSANSINIGRLLPQMLYYWLAADELHRQGVHERPTFVVPSGNLGNLTAGLMAASAGVPGASFLAALNRNDALARWLAHREIAANQATVRTPSSAMDVAQPSNLERLQWLERAQPSALKPLSGAEVVDDEATLDSLRDTWRQTGQLVCPHSAVGLAAARRARAAGASAPLIVLATAHAGKFPDVVRQATGVSPELPPALAHRWVGPERFERIAASLNELEAVLTHA